jgi:hypothetical protein
MAAECVRQGEALVVPTGSSFSLSRKNLYKSFVMAMLFILIVTACCDDLSLTIGFNGPLWNPFKLRTQTKAFYNQRNDCTNP